MLGKPGCRPVTRANGVRPVILLGVKRIIASADARWLLQYDAVSFVSPLLMASFSVRMVRSTYPLALLLPTVMRLWVMPIIVQSRWKLPANSAPLSVRTNLGFPQHAIMRWYMKSAARQLWRDGVGAASTHFEKGSMATSR